MPEVEGDKTAKAKFKSYPIGYFHIDIAEVKTAEGKLHFFLAINRTSKFVLIQLHQKTTTRVASDSLRTLIKAVPYNVHTVLTHNGTHFIDTRGGAWTPAEIKEKMAAANDSRLISSNTPAPATISNNG